MNFEQNQHIRAKGRGIFYLLLLAAIAMSALIGACNNVSGNGDSITLNLSYPAIIGTPDTAIPETNPTWSSTPEGVVVYAIEPTLPAGLYMELGTGIITGTPTAATEGEYTITAVFISSGTKTEKTATISITIKDISDFTDAEKVAADKADLDITSAVGGDLAAVKLDFALPTTGQKGTAISWEVDSGTAISLSGTSGESAVVTRPDRSGTDDTVVLRATFTLGAVSDTKDFTLTVKKQEDLTDQEAVDQDKTALSADSFQFAQGDAHNQVTRDFTLPTTGGEGSTISWTITSGTAIILSGTNNAMAAVARPDHVDGDAEVVLAAAIVKNSASDTKTFTLTVIKKDQVDIASLGSSEFSLTVDDTSVTALTGGTHSVMVGGSLIAGTDYDLSITAAGSGAVSIANDGSITMTSAIALSDTGSYTVTATGTGNYTGTVSDTFKLTVSAQPTLGAITYAEGDFTLDVQITPLSPSGTNSAQATYAMKTGENLPTGLSLAADGTISGTPTVGSQQTAYTIVATGKSGTVYDGEVKEITILISVDNDLASFFDFSLSPTTQTVTRNGQDKTITITIVSNDRGFTAGTEYGWGVTKKSDGSTPGFMAAANNEVVITAADIPGSSAEGTYKLTATGQGRYSGEVTKEFELDLPADALPGAPAITGITPGDSKLVVNWSAPADTGYHDAAVGEISGYTVYWDTSSGVSKSSANSQTTGASATSYEITGLANNQVVYVIVTATTDAGEGDASTAVSGTPVVSGTLPGAPTGLQTTAGDKQVTISWTAPTDGAEGTITKYIVYYHTVSFDATDVLIVSNVETANGTVATADVTGLTGGTQYFFRVTAMNAIGESELSDEVSIYANSTPGAPTIQFAVTDDKYIVLAWKPPTDGGYINSDGTGGTITHYTVYYHTASFTDSSKPSTKIDVPPSDEWMTSVDVLGLTNDTKYFFQVTAWNATGEGIPSEEVPGIPRDETAPTFTVTVRESRSGSTLYLKANEAITLLGTEGEQIAKLTVTHDDGSANPTQLPVRVVTLQNDGMTVKIETDMVVFILGQEVSVVIAEGFAADKAATPNNNIAATVKTTVALEPVVTSVTINEGNQNLDAGGTVQLSATVTGTNNPSQIVSWKSSDTNVATVSETGLVTVVSTATGGQTATITAESEEEAGMTGTITVTVN